MTFQVTFPDRQLSTTAPVVASWTTTLSDHVPLPDVLRALSLPLILPVRSPFWPGAKSMVSGPKDELKLPAALSGTCA
ncbi:MAG: hypothetical protein ACXWZZ_14400 [Solirubrobacteraceae bacterium]